MIIQSKINARPLKLLVFSIIYGASLTLVLAIIANNEFYLPYVLNYDNKHFVIDYITELKFYLLN